MTAADWDRLWKPNIFSLMRRGNDWHAGARSVHVGWIAELLQGVNCRGGSVAELGCGTALIARGLYERYSLASGVVVDFSAKALAVAAANVAGTSIQAIQADLLEWETAERFDLVLSVGLIEHFETAALDRIVRRHAELLRPGGHAVIIAPRQGWLWPALKVFNRPQGIIETPPRDEELFALLERSGLRLLRRKYYLWRMLIGVAADHRPLSS